MTTGRGRPGRPRKTSGPGQEGTPSSDGGVTIGGLSRGLQLLALFDRTQPEWSLNGLVERTGLHKSTVYRLVRTLESQRFLALDRDTGNYHLGPAMYRVAYLASAHSQLAHLARPHLQALAEATGETATIAVEEDDSAIVVDRILTSNPFKPVFHVGEIHGLFGNSHGKIFMAFKEPADRARFFERPIAALTANTLVDPVLYQRELDRIVAEGVAYELEEESPGFCGVSAPVWGPGGQLIASLSVVAPRERFGYAEQRRHGEAVKSQAAAFSSELGG